MYVYIPTAKETCTQKSYLSDDNDVKEAVGERYGVGPGDPEAEALNLGQRLHKHALAALALYLDEDGLVAHSSVDLRKAAAAAATAAAVVGAAAALVVVGCRRGLGWLHG